jgi:hypothetical protein
MIQGGAVDPGESILRRIPPNPDHYNPSLDPPISAFSFRPNKNDVDGISLYREHFTSVEALANSGRKPPYIVARLNASDIFALGLSLDPTPGEGDLPGHVVIPELSVSAYQNNRPFVREMNLKLAKLASGDVLAHFI